MALTLITAPAPILLPAFLREHLGVDTSVSDDYLAALIAAATDMIDGKSWLGRAIGVQTWELTYDTFPTGAIEIPLPPLVSVESVKYVNADTGSLDTFEAADYFVDTDSVPGWVVLGADASWPTPMSTANAVRIRFTAGYDPVPDSIKFAVALIAADLNDNRSATAEDVLKRGGTAYALLQKYWLPSI